MTRPERPTSPEDGGESLPAGLPMPPADLPSGHEDAGDSRPPAPPPAGSTGGGARGDDGGPSTPPEGPAPKGAEALEALGSPDSSGDA